MWISILDHYHTYQDTACKRHDVWNNIHSRVNIIWRSIADVNTEMKLACIISKEYSKKYLL